MKERETTEAVRGRMSDHGIRFTGGRQAIVRALQITSGPQSAAELHRRLRGTVPLSSLYRSLAVMSEAGILAMHHSNGLARYELAEWLAGHHHHLVCLQCGSVDDFELAPRQEKELHALVARVGGQHRYEVSNHALEVQGLCRSCR
ncbi:MAG TPA: transcriptional repressor [Acidimicrobiia bacterium]